MLRISLFICSVCVCEYNSYIIIIIEGGMKYTSGEHLLLLLMLTCLTFQISIPASKNDFGCYLCFDCGSQSAFPGDHIRTICILLVTDA